MVLACKDANSQNTQRTARETPSYPMVYSHGENLREIFTNPIWGVYIYQCTKNSQNKANVNLFNGIYIDKPTAEVKNQTVQNIFIFDNFPNLETFKNITDYEILLNAIIEQHPVMGFHRCYIKLNRDYYNQAYTYNKETKQYVFYDGAYGNWKATSSSMTDFKVKQSEYLGTWQYK